MKHNLRNYLISRGFEELKPWTEFSHLEGIHIIADEYCWTLTHLTDKWDLNGSLNEVGELMKTVEAALRGEQK